jgi:hypothetical protein
MRHNLPARAVLTRARAEGGSLASPLCRLQGAGRNSTGAERVWPVMSIRLTASFTVIALISLACGAAPGPTTAPTPETIALATQPQPFDACNDALAQGTLVADPQTGLALAAPNGERTLVSWPFGYYARLEDGQIVLVDAAGQAIAAEGDMVQMGGGFGAGNVFAACGGSVERVGA